MKKTKYFIAEFDNSNNNSIDTNIINIDGKKIIISKDQSELNINKIIKKDQIFCKYPTLKAIKNDIETFSFSNGYGLPYGRYTKLNIVNFTSDFQIFLEIDQKSSLKVFDFIANILDNKKSSENKLSKNIILDILEDISFKSKKEKLFKELKAFLTIEQNLIEFNKKYIEKNQSLVNLFETMWATNSNLDKPIEKFIPEFTS